MSSQKQSLMFTMGLDADAFRRQLTRVNADVQKQSEGIKGSLAQAFTLSAAALAFKEIGERMVELRRKSEDLGVSIESLQGIERLGVKFGGSAEQTDNALMKLTLAIGNARTEGGAAAESFSRFGIELYNTNGTAKTTEEVFKDIADAYKGSSDAATKAALAFEFFGRTGKDINNILDMGADGIAKYVEESVGLGTTATANVNALAEAWLSVKEAFSERGVFSNTLGLITRVVKSASATLGALSAGAGLEQAQGIAGAQDAELANVEQERAKNAQASDRAIRDAKNAKQLRADLAKSAEDYLKAQNLGAEIKGKRELVALTLQELSARARLVAVQDGPGREKAELSLLSIVRQRGEAERKIEDDKLALMQSEERELRKSVKALDDGIEKERAVVALKEKQNQLDEQRNKLAENEARILEQRNRLQQDVRDVETKRADRTRYTLAELAGANLRGLRGNAALTESAIKAKEVARLIGVKGDGGLAREALNRGDTAAAELIFAKADAITATIGNLKSNEKLNTIANDMAKVRKSVEEWNAGAKDGSHKVQVAFGKNS